MNTASCKALLIQSYPETLTKDWKRESKYKNALEQDVRRFRHPTIGVVYISDNGWSDAGKVGIDGELLEFKMASSFTASDFYYSVVVLPNYEPVTAQIWFAYKYNFDRIPEVDDILLASLFEKWLPKDLVVDEATESCFETMNKLTKAEITKRFSESGFTRSQKFDDHIHDSYGVSEPPL